MTTKTKKIRHAGRFGAGYGTRIRKKLNIIESIQRKKQVCPHCAKPGVKRVASGIWHCRKCDKRFAGHAYYLEKQA
ncbi:50S ribosomal protein L37ae [Candidatus Pacearchaeota archaeon CG_4_9_14_0_2_um_filter_39_13]|nr:50S ribosomal protein L37ae [Candidatus Pacearchaeota archaeon]OIO44101.1 MAG: 50S ribosomal protein L37ae [Candidatus Pacearchaeota archaeon CG1_02_39_14]PJC44390.1 MAG: 50S ribosomal protein L37ae [Candidatus Pacearchaeota archaeon CG_4_9_14_0_2_um_filter_39_13]